MSLSRRQCLLGFVAFTLMPGNCFARNDAPPTKRTITDALGRRVTLDKTPQRIVSIFSSNTELLHALDATDQIVGIEDYTQYPPGIRDNRTIVGGRLGFSAETIARLEPDLVIMTPARQAVNTLLRPMEIVGVPVVVLLHRNIEQIFSNLGLLGTVLGNAAHAQTVVQQLKQRLQQVESQIKTSPRPSVFFETSQNDRGNFATVRKGHYAHDALQHAGGDNIFSELKNINQVSGEAVISANPDVIFVARRESDVSGVLNRPGWQQVNAIRHRRVYQVPRELLLIPGPRIVDGVETMAALLHPDQFGPS